MTVDFFQCNYRGRNFTMSHVDNQSESFSKSIIKLTDGGIMNSCKEDSD